jgi:hypothetical protein
VRLTISRAYRRKFTLAATMVAALTAMLATALPATAHEPVQLGATDVLPWQGPLILDGQSPTMLFGVLPRPGAVRSAQLHMTAGEHLIINLAIPDEAPENQLPIDALPIAIVVSPHFEVTELKATPGMRVPIRTESGESLLLVRSYSSVAISGNYSILMTGAAPARFAVATGVEGQPFAGLRRGRIATDEEVSQWYNTPPPSYAGRAVSPVGYAA